MKENLQVTPEGYDRYYELMDLLRDEPNHPQLLGQYSALHSIMVLHPLDYVFIRESKAPTRQDYINLVRDGYAIVVEDNYRQLMSNLRTYDPELLPVFQTYKKVAYGEYLDEWEIDDALGILKRRIDEEESRMARPGALTDIWSLVGVPRTKQDKIIALDTIISKIHYDPDLIRQLPKRDQPIVGGSILAWLNQLAGR